MISPRLLITITRNHVAVRDCDSGASATSDGPFSCSHLLITDLELFEHLASHALKTVVRGGWKFPTAEVTTPAYALHPIEKQAITAALLNSGLRKVTWVEEVTCPEQSGERQAYIDRHRRKP